MIGPFSNFTCIVGPNGAGKSNLMDAICFVLGLRAVQLRSVRTKDLIYHGKILSKKGGKNDENRDPNIMQTQDSDESESDDYDNTPVIKAHSCEVVAVFEDDNGEEIRFSHGANAQGDSEYRVDGKKVSYQRYNKALEDRNIIAKAKNFLVFQGDIETIASQAPKDLTKLIEQISGSNEFKTEYDRLKAQYDAATEELANAYSKKRGLNAEVRQYQEQKDEAERFNVLQGELSKLTAEHYLWKMYAIDCQINGNVPVLEQLFQRLQQLCKERNTFNDKIEAFRRDQARLQKEQRKLDRCILERQKDTEVRKTELYRYDETIAHLKRKLAQATNNNAQLTADVEKRQTSYDNHCRELESVQIALQRHQQHINQQSRGIIKLSPDQRNAYKAIRLRVDEATFNDKGQVEQCDRQERLAQGQLSQQNEKLRVMQGRKKILLEGYDIAESRRADLASQKADNDLKLDELREKMKGKQDDAQKSKREEEELSEQLEKVVAQITRAKVSMRDSERSSRKKDSITRLKHIYPGVHGTVEELCRPVQRKYDIAASLVLGRHRESLIVDNEKTALECIRYLKEQRAGSMTFIPLDSIETQTPTENGGGAWPKGATLAIDIIQYEASLERAFEYVCGNTICCENIEIARQICFGEDRRVKAVTIEGMIIHRSGLMSGGSQAAIARQHAQRTEAREIDALRKKRDEYVARLHEVRKTLGHGNAFANTDALQSEISTLELQNEAIARELVDLERRLKDFTREVEHITASENEAHEKIGQIGVKIKALALRREDADKSIMAAEADVFKSLCDELGISSIREYEEEHEKIIRKHEEETAEHVALQSKLENQRNFVQRQLEDVQKRVQKIRESVAVDRDCLAEFETKREEHLFQDHETAVQLSTMRKESSEYRDEITKKTADIANVKRQIVTLQRTLDAETKDVIAKETQIQKLLAELRSIVRKCGLDEINIPMVRGRFDEAPIPEEQTSAQSIVNILGDADDDRMDVDQDENVVENLLTSYRSRLSEYIEFSSVAHLQEMVC